MSKYEEFEAHQLKKGEFEAEMIKNRATFGDDKHTQWLYEQLFETENELEKTNERLAKHERFLNYINRASSNFHMMNFKED